MLIFYNYNIVLEINDSTFGLFPSTSSWAMTEAPVRHILLPMIIRLWLTLKIYGLMLAKLNLGWNLIFKTFKKPELYHRWGKRKPHKKSTLAWHKNVNDKGIDSFLGKIRSWFEFLKDSFTSEYLLRHFTHTYCTNLFSWLLISTLLDIP